MLTILIFNKYYNNENKKSDKDLCPSLMTASNWTTHQLQQLWFLWHYFSVVLVSVNEVAEGRWGPRGNYGWDRAFVGFGQLTAARLVKTL